MQLNSTLYNLIRCFCGLYFVLQGCIQVDCIGKRLFSNINQFFTRNYYTYVHSIPWKSVGLSPSADQFREVVGYIILAAGVLLVLNLHVKLSSTVMCLLGAWSVYAHILASDPGYTVALGGLFCALMFVLAYARPSLHEKVD